MRHDILFLPSIPRQKDKLTAMLNEARHVRRKQQMIQYVTAAMVIAGILILIIGR